MEKAQKSFSQELCENKALISAANTTDLVSLIDPVNYSEETAELIAGLTNTSFNYVKDVMNETTEFSQNFSEENYPIFINALNKILAKNNEEINNNFSEYMKNIENFSEEDANTKVEKLSKLISLIDDEVIKDLGTDYVSIIISNSTDTDKDMLKDVLDKYLMDSNKDDEIEEKKEEIKNIIEDKKDDKEDKIEEQKELVTEKFNEVFIKKDGQYFKFNDATVSIPKAVKNFGEYGKGVADTLEVGSQTALGVGGVGTVLAAPKIVKLVDKNAKTVITQPKIYKEMLKMEKSIPNKGIMNKATKGILKLDNKLYKTIVRNPKTALAVVATAPIASKVVENKLK